MSFYVNTSEGRKYDNNLQRLRASIWQNTILTCLADGDFGRVVAIHNDKGQIVQQIFFVILKNAIYPAYTNCNKKRETYRSYWPIFRYDAPTVFVGCGEKECKGEPFEDMIEVLSLKNRQILCWNRG